MSSNNASQRLGHLNQYVHEFHYRRLFGGNIAATCSLWMTLLLLSVSKMILASQRPWIKPLQVRAGIFFFNLSSHSLPPLDLLLLISCYCLPHPTNVSLSPWLLGQYAFWSCSRGSFYHSHLKYINLLLFSSFVAFKWFPWALFFKGSFHVYSSPSLAGACLPAQIGSHGDSPHMRSAGSPHKGHPTSTYVLLQLQGSEKNSVLWAFRGIMTNHFQL